MPVPPIATRQGKRLGRLAHAGLDSFAFRERAIAELRRTVPFDAAWWWTIDPASTFFTSGVFDPAPTDHAICANLHRNELGSDDYNKFRDLARRSDPAAVLSTATGGRVERSDRYRTTLVPLGYEHELRVALRERSNLWGGLTLLRRPGDRDFTPDETRTLAAAEPLLTRGLRIGVALGADHVDYSPDGPAVLTLDADLTIVSSTPNAARWLDELSDGSTGVPDAVRSVVAYVRALHDDERTTEHMPRARVRGRSGRWLVVYAALVTETSAGPAAAPPDIAVIIQEAAPAEIAPLILDAYGLSSGEARVVSLVLQGLPSRQVAAALHLSPHTVHDYLKTIYAKVGVHSRQQLAATLFEQRHWPRFGLGDKPPEFDGALAGSHDTGRPST